MIEGFKQLFAPGATTVVFSPFLLLFIILGLGVFIAAPLVAVAVAGVLGGLLLRSCGLTVSRSFTRAFLLIALVFQFVFILFAIKKNAWFLLRRPQVHAASPTPFCRVVHMFGVSYDRLWYDRLWYPSRV